MLIAHLSRGHVLDLDLDFTQLSILRSPRSADGEDEVDSVLELDALADNDESSSVGGHEEVATAEVGLVTEMSLQLLFSVNA